MRNSFLSRPTSRGVRWGAPVAAAAVLIGVGPAVTALNADAHSSLPSRTAAQLLVEVQQARLQALSGTVVETSDLGLPELPSVGGHGGGGASFSSLISGSHTMRLWYAGPDRMRIALLGQLDESDLVRNGTDLWSWSSSDNTATHWTVPDHSKAPGTLAATGAPMTPQQAAEAALEAIDPTTQVSTDPTAEVAGRPAYQLDLVPRDSRSRIGSVRIAIDGATKVPTRVQVFAKGASSPALQVGFTSFSTATPPASTFSFTPPPGATVKQGSGQSAPQHAGPAGAEGSAPQVVGKGWTTVVVADLGEAPDQDLGKDPGTGPGTGLAGALRALPSVSGSWGSGHLLEGTLFSAVLTDDGRLAVGAVAPRMLYDALATARAR